MVRSERHLVHFESLVLLFSYYVCHFAQTSLRFARLPQKSNSRRAWLDRGIIGNEVRQSLLVENSF
jgi:hypothetical protein